MHSPHLRSVLSLAVRNGRLTSAESDVVQLAFEIAMKGRGIEEYGFVRPEGQSFNPRAARIPIILLNDAEICDDKLLVKGCEACGRGSEYEGYFDAKQEQIIAAVLLLDRLRHLHMEKLDTNKPLLLERSEVLAAGIDEQFPKIALKLREIVKKIRNRDVRARS